MRIGYARHLRHWTTAKQESILTENGVKTIYVEGRGAETFEEAKKRIRSSRDTIELAGGLRVLGDSRRAIMERIALVKGKGGAIVDVVTGERLQVEAGAEMLDRAMTKIHGDAAIGPRSRAVKMGSKGGTVAGEKRRRGRMAQTEALVIWRSHPELDNKEVLKLMRGWTLGTAYRRLKRRDVPSGPRGNN